MPTICPNCLRPVRSEARFCGYCGSNLSPTSLDEVSATIPAVQKIEPVKEALPPQPKPKADGEKIRRTILIVIVILLILILLATFLIHYWPTIGSYLGALITLFLLRTPK